MWYKRLADQLIISILTDKKPLIGFCSDIQFFDGFSLNKLCPNPDFNGTPDYASFVPLNQRQETVHGFGSE